MLRKLTAQLAVFSSGFVALTAANWCFAAGKRLVIVLAILATVGVPAEAMADIRVTDAQGRAVVLEAPARRIISLAPHITEMLFYAGAGDRIVGTVTYSDYPEAAKKIPRIGDNKLIDLERIVSLRPDLIIVWRHGNAQRQLDKLLGWGIPVFFHEPRTLTDIADSLIDLGRLAGTETTARKAAREYMERLNQMRERYSARPPVSLFYQIWEKPLLTINKDQIINDAIQLCGGRNVFADAKLLVPTVGIEAVMNANPEAIVASKGMGSDNSDGLALWRRLPSLRATANGNLVLIDASSISRHSPRMLDGARILCEELEAVRRRRIQ